MYRLWYLRKSNALLLIKKENNPIKVFACKNKDEKLG